MEEKNISFCPMYLVRMPLGLFLHQLIYKIDLYSISLWLMKRSIYITLYKNEVLILCILLLIHIGL